MERDITTIQLHERVKHVLDRLKGTGKESYEDVILDLIRRVEMQKRIKTELLIEGYKDMGAESRKIAKLWEKTERDWE